MVILLAGLQVIPKEYYEAAQIDGASAWSWLRHITIPLMPAITVTTVLNLLYGLKVFDIVYVLTNAVRATRPNCVAAALWAPCTLLVTYLQSRSDESTNLLGVVLVALSSVQILAVCIGGAADGATGGGDRVHAPPGRDPRDAVGDGARQDDRRRAQTIPSDRSGPSR